MKINKLKYMVGVALMSAFVNANAQDLPQAAVPTPAMPNVVVATPSTTPVVAPQPEQITDYSRGGNSFEREVTPLLREISRKKSILEIRKLDREIEKLDEESLKAQSGGDSANANTFVPLPTPQNIPSAMPVQSTPAPTQMASNNADFAVVMIYGYEKDLYAKISYGTKGGYPVKKGDILPNGEYVYDVTPNYVEVGSVPNAKTKKKSKTMKVYATGYPRQGGNGSGGQSEGLQLQPNGTFPLPTGIPSAPLVSNSGLISNSPTIGLPVLAPLPEPK